MKDTTDIVCLFMPWVDFHASASICTSFGIVAMEENNLAVQNGFGSTGKYEAASKEA